MRWREAVNHALRLADGGYETTIRVHALDDATCERLATLRVLKASILDLAAFLEDAKDDGLNVHEAGEYLELT